GRVAPRRAGEREDAPGTLAAGDEGLPDRPRAAVAHALELPTVLRPGDAPDAPADDRLDQIRGEVARAGVPGAGLAPGCGPPHVDPGRSWVGAGPTCSGRRNGLVRARALVLAAALPSVRVRRRHLLRHRVLHRRDPHPLRRGSDLHRSSSPAWHAPPPYRAPGGRIDARGAIRPGAGAAASGGSPRAGSAHVELLPADPAGGDAEPDEPLGERR